ncbi:cucumber peeling cupredoxin-like [Solanum pennellii]|uniref:Cucumber peeling cupredoxin-like n=1 Tax=Solanum pennellii TaxID=28526 RepID=A0ABM1FIS5_SOLPN|nr:cucumber peeling cupredoxin-like [Solanum lycopersicum]XP_015057429.1 cucumber peeling cupredoxin-like [Solanum pennellii]
MHFIIILLLYVIGILINLVNSERYIVGEGYGWGPAPYPTYYQDWATTVKLKPGDQLEFRFQKPEDLLEIGKYNYYACNSNTLSRQYKDSPAIAFMLVPGDYYFKSSNNTNCINGQKLYVNVAAPIEDEADDKI